MRGDIVLIIVYCTVVLSRPHDIALGKNYYYSLFEMSLVVNTGGNTAEGVSDCVLYGEYDRQKKYTRIVCPIQQPPPSRQEYLWRATGSNPPRPLPLPLT